MPDRRGGDVLPRRYAQTRYRMAAAALAGAVAALGQAPFGFWPATLAGLAVAVALLGGAAGPRRAAWTGWAAGTGYFAVSLHWIVEPFFVDVARHGWMAPFALVFLSGGLALFWAAAFAAARRIALGPYSLALGWTGAMGLAELGRGYLLSGFPWALPGYAWTETAALGLAPLVGPYGLTLLTLALAALLGAALLRRRVSAALPAAALGLAMGVTVAAQPGAALPDDALPGDAAGPVVRLVQPNAAQRDKWDPRKVNEFFRRQLAYTAGGEGPRPALVIWPETAIPWDLAEHEVARGMVAEAAGGVPVAVGLQRSEAGRYYNSLALMDATGTVTQVYDKHHLVPFGEFIPFGQVARLVGLRSFASRDGYGFSAGPGPRTLDFGPLGRALPLICYEAIFPQNVRGAPVRPDWLLQVTNDAWFGNFAGPQQHLEQARVRAAEQGLPMVRVANTGISAVIDASGAVVAALPLDTAGYLDVALPPSRPPTVYAATGDTPALATALLLLVAGFLGARGKTD